MKLMPDHTRLSYLLLRVTDACEVNSVHLRHGASKPAWKQNSKVLTTLRPRP